MNEIKQVEVFLHDEKIGRMALTPDKLCAFEYEPQFLSSGFSISPFFLPLKNELFIAKRHPFQGGFGGAFISSILQGKTLAEAHQTAVDKAAFVCTRAGAWV